MVEIQSKKKIKKMNNEVTLDPENWDEFRELSHKILDEMLTYNKNIRNETTNYPTKEAIAKICTPLPANGDGEEAVYNLVKRSVIPYTIKVQRPRFWGFVAGQGSPYGMIADMIRSGSGDLEALTIGGTVHRQTIDWIKEMLDYPSEAGGVIVHGGSEANFTGLAVARNAKAEVDMKAKGMQGVPRKMIMYVSEEGHECLERSAELIGIGNEALRRITVDDKYRIKVDALRKAISDDRELGFHPFCVIGNAGTVNTGAFDDFNALADLAEREGMWLHVDGAFGAWVKLSRTHRGLANGIERADSLAVDLHKWMDMPYGVGCTLVRDRLAHYSTFVYGHEAQYLKSAHDRIKDQVLNPHQLSIALSRDFSCLKVYMLLRAYGRERYSRLVQRNLDQMKEFASKVKSEPDMEVTAPVASNIVCFRYKPAGLDEQQLEKLNKLILSGLWERNLGVVTDTTLRGMYMLRACNVNHRTRYEDFDWLIAEVKKFGEKILPDIYV